MGDLVDFQFVSYSPTQKGKSKPKAGSTIVRAQAARHQWKQDLAVRTAKKAAAGKQRKPPVRVLLRIVDEKHHNTSPEDENTTSSGSPNSFTSSLQYSDSPPSSVSGIDCSWNGLGNASNALTSPIDDLGYTWMDASGVDDGFALPPVELLIGGTRGDPFCCYPVQSKSYFPATVDHYLIHMAINIPELDQTNVGSLRSVWFPLILTEPSLFLVIMLLAASHHSSVSIYDALSAKTFLRLKQETLESINTSLQRQDQSLVTDALIGSVAKIASYESMYGDLPTYNAHMIGLKRMVEVRGGLDKLGLGGLLRRMIIWIDTNAAFLNGAPLYFPGEVFAERQKTIEPDSMHFIGDSR